MATITGIDHILIQVTDLEAAIRDYTALGFTVARGGRHPGFTENALVPFADGTYLELLAPWREPDEEEGALWRAGLARGGGLYGYALATRSVEDALRELNERGLATTGPRDGSRARPDGERVAWRTAAPAETAVGAMPFLIEDVTPRSLRVAGGEAATHANGIRGVFGVTVLVGDREAAVARYEALLGYGWAQKRIKWKEGPQEATFEVGRNTITVKDPDPRDEAEVKAAASDHLVEVLLEGSQPLELDPAKARNARLRVLAV